MLVFDVYAENRADDPTRGKPVREPSRAVLEGRRLGLFVERIHHLPRGPDLGRKVVGLEEEPRDDVSVHIEIGYSIKVDL